MNPCDLTNSSSFQAGQDTSQFRHFSKVTGGFRYLSLACPLGKLDPSICSFWPFSDSFYMRYAYKQVYTEFSPFYQTDFDKIHITERESILAH